MAVRFNARSVVGTACFVLLIALGGCGQSDEEEVRGTVVEFYDGLADRDGERVCPKMEEDFREGLLEDIKEISGFDTTCEDFIDDPPSWLAKTLPRNPKVENVDIDGDEATADVSGDNSRAEPELKKLEGEWRITEF